MRVVGFSLVSQAVQLDFPVREALRSILPLVDELVVNVGPSDDGTRELLTGLGEPRLRLLEGRWDTAAGGHMLAVETQRALDACDGDWAIYIQADEVLHEAGLVPLRDALERHRADPAVEGLLVDFVHLYGSTDWEAGGRQWYRREVRVVRPGRGIVSVGDAQGFRVAPQERPLRVRRAGATYFHYGWARPLAALAAKREADNLLHYGGAPRRAAVGDSLPWDVGLRRFGGTHPAEMQPWIGARRAAMSPGFSPRRWDLRRVALLASLGVERLTGWRPFERAGYVEL